MRRKLIALSLATAAVLTGCAGASSTKTETTEQSAAETSVEAVTTTVIEETTTEADETKESGDKNQVKKKDLVGKTSDDSYYNPYFNLGFYFNEYWEHQECKNKEYENWRKQDKIPTFTPFSAHVETKINYIFFNIEKNVKNMTAEERADRYIEDTANMYELDKFTVEKKEKVYLNIDDEKLPAALLVASNGDVSQHVLTAFKEKDGLIMYIQITGFNDDTVFSVANMIYKEN